MPITLQDYITHHYLDKNKRILALDVGDKYIGLAMSDGLQMIASPLTLYKRKNNAEDIKYLQGLAKDYACCAILVGLPQNLRGDLSRQGEKIVGFCEKLAVILDELGIPILFWDERFSTQAVEKTMISFDFSRKKREELIDKLAATYILQGALDFLAMHRRQKEAAPLKRPEDSAEDDPEECS